MKRQLRVVTAGVLEPAAQRLWKSSRRRIFAGIGFAWLSLAAAQTNPPVPAPSLTLTNINQIWDVTGEAAQHPQRIQTDVLIYYFDADWSCVFGECRGRQTF